MKMSELTNMEKLIHYFENTTPEQFLSDISGGAEPSKKDLQIVEEIRIKHKLPDGVINVLIDSVLRITNMKFSKNHVEKTAYNWAEKNVQTVEEAIATAKKEYQQGQLFSKSVEHSKEPEEIKKLIRILNLN